MSSTNISAPTRRASTWMLICALSVAWLHILPSEARAEEEQSPAAQGANFHLTAADGRKTLGQLLLEQSDLQPGTNVISRLHIFNSASHGSLTLVTIPGHAPDFNFDIDPGQDKNFPLSKPQDVTLTEIPVECESVCNFYAYWEFYR